MLPLELDKENRIPYYLQLGEQIRLLVHNGTLAPGDALPTVRALAVQLKINANTVARVYRDLQEAGVLELRRGIGTFVSDTCPNRLVAKVDLQQLREHAQALVGLAKQNGIRSVELQQLIQRIWKEIT